MDIMKMVANRNISIPLHAPMESSIEPDAALIAWTGYVLIIKNENSKQSSVDDTFVPFPSLG